MLLYRFAEACGYVREQHRQDGRAGAPTEPFVCLGQWLRHAGLRPGSAGYESYEGERLMAWGNLCGGSSGIPAAGLPVMGLAV